MQWGEPAKPHNEPLNLSGAVSAHYDDDDDNGVGGGDDDSEGDDGDEDDDDDDGDHNEPVWGSSGCCHLFIGIFIYILDDDEKSHYYLQLKEKNSIINYRHLYQLLTLYSSG